MLKLYLAPGQQFEDYYLKKSRSGFLFICLSFCFLYMIQLVRGEIMLPVPSPCSGKSVLQLPSVHAAYQTPVALRSSWCLSPSRLSLIRTGTFSFTFSPRVVICGTQQFSQDSFSFAVLFNTLSFQIITNIILLFF